MNKPTFEQWKANWDSFHEEPPDLQTCWRAVESYYASFDIKYRKPYYIMVHFGGPYVDGFIVPQATDEMHALRQLRVLIWAKRKTSLQKVAEGVEFSPGTESDPNRLQEIIRSLKRPWRKPGGYRINGEKKAKPHWSKQAVVEITELKLPCHTGFWVEDILTGNICNNGPHWRVNRPSP